MIYLIDLEKECSKLVPVTSSEYTSGKGLNLHPEGLFSEIIFGPKESPSRQKAYSFVNLYCKILHPALYPVIYKLNRKILFAIERKATYSFDDSNFLVEDEAGEIHGLSAIYKNFRKIISARTEEGARLDMQKMILKYYDDGMAFINKCLIIPAGYRDAAVDEVHGGYRVDPINDYYQKIIRLSIQLQSLALSEGPIFEILSAKMMSLVKELYDFILERISKKQGLIRGDVLGKRADFTGRAVITGAGSEVKVDEIGIPFKILVKLFEPFVLHDIVNTDNTDKAKLAEILKKYNNSTLSVPALRSLFGEIQRGHEIPPDLEQIIKAAVIRATADKVVLAKRDPALHAESVQGFRPILIDGETIKINIAKCHAYNADFDGDMMAIYVPVTKEAIEEARQKTISSQYMDSIDMVSDDFSKDIVAGIYALTRNPDPSKGSITIKDDSELDTLDPVTRVKYDGENTTAGRILFNKALPSKKYWVSEPIDKKKLSKLMQRIYKDVSQVDKKVYIDACHNIMKLGMKYYTICGISFSMTDLKVPAKVLHLKDKMAGSSLEDADKLSRQIEEELKQYYSTGDTNLSLLYNSGASKGMGQIRQIVAAKGLIQSIEGEVLNPIGKSYADGFTSKEYFDSGIGARAGIVDRVINTSVTGYFSRQLVYALQRVEADPGIKDCKTKRFLTLRVTDDIERRLHGRYILNKNSEIVPFSKEYNGKVIHLRTPIYCLTKRLCKTCYGDLMVRNKTHYVGILAGQILGEPLTQSIMRTFHVGGAVNIKTIDIIDEMSKILEDNDRQVFTKNFKQEGSKLKALIDGNIEIDVSLYKDPKKDIETTKDSIKLTYAYFKVNYLAYSIDVTIDNRIEIDLRDKTFDEKDGIIRIFFKKDSEVLNCVPTSEIFTEKVKMIATLLSGRIPWRDANHFCMKIYDLYKDIANRADFVHFEVLASNLLRDKGNPSYPARLNPKYNPVVGSLKKIPQLESWLQALAFEDPNQSITTGLLYNRPQDETILEQIITGNFEF